MRRPSSGRRAHAGGMHTLLRRGSTLRMFGAFILVAGLISLVLGVYLVGETAAQPSADHSVTLIFGAFFLAGGIIPVFYLFVAVIRKRYGEWLRRGRIRSGVTPPSVDQHAMQALSGKESAQLPFQKIYVDSARIRP